MYPYFKRFFDFTVALLGILMLLPVYLILFFLLWIAFKGKPFFTQKRPGLNEKIFCLYKFKTMNDRKGGDGQLLPDGQRITFLGRILRKTSLDELPQLFNVLKGDMSLIGPRPLLPRYLPYYSEQERLRHTIRPGITGYAQVNGRNVSSWKDRLQADIYYINNMSFSLDVKIFFQTFKSIFIGKDIVVDPDSIMLPLDVERSLNQ